MKDFLKRLWDRLAGRERAATAMPAVVGAGQPSEICEAEWRQLIEINRDHAYQTGLAEGELRGRLLLANELERQFGVGQREFTAEEAAKTRQRQIH